MSNEPLTQVDEIPGVEEEASALRQAEHEAAIRLLRELREGDENDEQEQRETWEYLKRALDEDRLSDRKLFP